MKTSSKKQKGRILQQWLVKKLSTILDIPVEKDGDIESRPMGQSGCDIILRGKAKDLFPFAVEAKNQETFKLKPFMEQAIDNQKKFNYPYWLLLYKKNFMKPIVIMDAEDFLNIFFKEEKEK